MIFLNIGQVKRYDFFKDDIKTCFEYVTNNDLCNLKTGKYNIKGEDIFVNIVEYNTVSKEERFWEAHRDYIDIHFMIKGKEIINLNFISNLNSKEYKKEEDFLSLEGENSSFVTLSENDFLVFYPEDAHMTAIKVDDSELIKKAIFKVKIV